MKRNKTKHFTALLISLIILISPCCYFSELGVPFGTHKYSSTDKTYSDMLSYQTFDDIPYDYHNLNGINAYKFSYGDATNDATMAYIIGDGANGTMRGICITYTLSGTVNESSAAAYETPTAGYNSNTDSADYSIYDGISFYAKGTGLLNQLIVKVQTLDITSLPEPYKYDTHNKTFTITESWQKYTLPWDELERSDYTEYGEVPFAPERIHKITFVIENPTSYLYNNKFYIDEIMLIKQD